MENQRKKLESRKFFEKKIRTQGTFKRKKSYEKIKKIQQKKFYIKKLKNITKQILHSENK